MKKVDEKLKQFMLDNFCFDSMKEMGFWPKGTRRNDYQAQADRVCQWFGYKSIYEYNAPEITDIGNNTSIAECRGSVSEQGEYVQGATALFNTIPSEFECPICTCPQTIKPEKTNGVAHKCTGCKRKLHVIVPLFSCNGDISVTEW